MYSYLDHGGGAPRLSPSQARCLGCACRREGLCAVPERDADAAPPPARSQRRLRRGETVIWAGEAGQDIANLVSGALKLVASSDDGVERAVGLVLPGGFVGDLLGQEARFTAIALVDSVVCLFGRGAVARLIAQSPGFALAALRRTSGDLDQARDWVRLTGGCGARARIATLLSMLAAGRSADDAAIAIPLSRGEMGDLLGLRLETVSRQMNALAQEGIIALPDRHSFVLLDPDRLNDAALRPSVA